jgi:repressor LexA
VLRGDRLKQLRHAHNYTLEQLAEQLDIGLRQLNRYEANESDATSKVVTRMAQVLGTSADYLLGLSDDPGEQYVEEPLSAEERKLIMAIRQGNQNGTFEALAALTKPTE